jgi:hypothetical protein
MLFRDEDKGVAVEVRMLLDNATSRETKQSFRSRSQVGKPALDCIVPVRLGQVVAIEYRFAGLGPCVMDLKVDGTFRYHEKHADSTAQQRVDMILCREGSLLYRTPMAIHPLEERSGCWPELGTIQISFHLPTPIERTGAPGRTSDQDNLPFMGTIKGMGFSNRKPTCRIRGYNCTSALTVAETQAIRKQFDAPRSHDPFVTFRFHYREENPSTTTFSSGVAAPFFTSGIPSAAWNAVNPPKYTYKATRNDALISKELPHGSSDGTCQVDDRTAKLHREVSDEEYAALLTYIELPVQPQLYQHDGPATATPSSPKITAPEVTRKRTVEEMENEANILQAKAAALFATVKRLKAGSM